jgi:hypothetical protein
MTRPWETLATEPTPDGPLELRRRGDRDFLITVAGRVLMTSAAHRSEDAVATVIRSPGARRVDELFDASPRLRHWVEVHESLGKSRKEIHALATEMARRGLRRLAADQLEERPALLQVMLEQAPDARACVRGDRARDAGRRAAGGRPAPERR